MAGPLEHWSWITLVARQLRAHSGTYGRNMSGSNHRVHLFYGMRQYTAIRPHFKLNSPHGGGSKCDGICRTTCSLPFACFVHAPQGMLVPILDYIFKYSRSPGAHTEFLGRLRGKHQPSRRGYTTQPGYPSKMIQRCWNDDMFIPFIRPAGD